LLGRDRAVNQLSSFHMSPLIVRAVSPLRILGTSTAWIAARLSCVAEAFRKKSSPSR
jgi:hypothetical protein